jgi:hypothetical protein
MIRNAKKTDSINLAALSIQVWLHTYATEGIRKEISSLNRHTVLQICDGLFYPQLSHA